MGDFEVIIFSQTSRVRNFSALYVMNNGLFSAGYCFPRNFFAGFSPLEISPKDIFF